MTKLNAGRSPSAAFATRAVSIHSGPRGSGIAVSPSNAAAMAHALEAAKKAGIPVLTWDSDVLPKDKDLRIAYIGTHNYDIGVNLAPLLAKELTIRGAFRFRKGR